MVRHMMHCMVHCMVRVYCIAHCNCAVRRAAACATSPPPRPTEGGASRCRAVAAAAPPSKGAVNKVAAPPIDASGGNGRMWTGEGGCRRDAGGVQARGHTSAFSRLSHCRLSSSSEICSSCDTQRSIACRHARPTALENCASLLPSLPPSPFYPPPSALHPPPSASRPPPLRPLHTRAPRPALPRAPLGTPS